MQLLEIFFGSKTKIKILRTLCQQKQWNFSVVELSKDLSLNKGVVSRVLNQLQKDGIVKIIRKGKVKLCRVNRENRIVNELIVPIFEKEQNIIDSILKYFLKELNPRRFRSVLSVIAYGSVVKGLFKLTSDLDLMLILSNKSEISSIKKILDKIVDKFSKEDIILFCDLITREEFRKLYEQNEPSVKDIARFNRVLYGKDVLELM
ncbi:MAG: nucleotidyltransferase domain-containing protein [Euryarchaeota archaeon]|nr:nucleotidyltransferase domain-containing protein [Euryarchaeota archaeon]